VTFKADKVMPARSKSAGAPSDAQLAQILAFCLNQEMSADQLYTRSFVLAHNCIDRDNEVFDEGVLADFAKTLPGKGIFIKHPNSWDGDSGPAEGKVYNATLQTMSLAEAQAYLKEPNLTLPPDRSMVTLLTTDGYFAKTPENTALLTKMDAGIAGDVSIGFSATSRVPIKDAQGRELQACRILGPGEGLEQSLVWLGAQPGARAVKGATRSNQNHSEETDMDQKEFDTQLAAEKAKTAAEAAKALANETAKTALEALKNALGKDHAALADNPAELATLALAGKAARESLVDDVIADLRQKGAVGDKPEEVQAAKKAYAGMPFAHLKALAGTSGKAANDAPPRSPMANGNPNVTGAKDAPPAGCLAANPLI